MSKRYKDIIENIEKCNIDFISTFDNVLNKEQCKTLIDIFDDFHKKHKTAPGGVGAGDQQSINLSKKKSYDISFASKSNNKELDDLFLTIIKKISMYTYYYLLYIGFFGAEFAGIPLDLFLHNLEKGNIEEMPDNIMLTASFLRYYPKKKGGYFVPHHDNSGLATRRRIVAIILYLNDVEYGGETIFPVLKRRITPKMGRLAIFPSFITHLHYGNSSPEAKYVVVSHIEDRSVEIIINKGETNGK